jgi:hypothetical protein
MPDVIWRGIPMRWRLGLELLVFLAAGCALLAQIGCESAAFVTSANLHLQDVEYRPTFVMNDQSPPAASRYWVSLNHPIQMRWARITYVSNGSECNVCSGQSCASMPTFTVTPAIVVSYRDQAGADAEEARLSYTASCGTDRWGEFTPRAPEMDKEEERRYLASIQFQGGSPIPADSSPDVSFRIIPKSITMPPRRLHAKDSKTFEWPAPSDSGPPLLYETFDPALQVGKVRIVQGVCSAPRSAAPSSDAETERLRFECGDDKFLNSDIDDTALVVPYRVIVTNGDNSEDYQTCDSRPDEQDGGISFGRDPGNQRMSLCVERSSPQLFKRMTPTFLVGTQDRRRLVWKVEFDEEKGFPPPPMGTELWIFFTLEPLP